VQTQAQLKVLFAVLNWGMGHASRSVPIIRALKGTGAKVVLASDGVAADLLQKEFPDLELHILPGYNVTYPSKSIYINVLLSGVHILNAIRKEKAWLRKFRKSNVLDLIISDNRYGIQAKDLPSVLITHQLTLLGKSTPANRIGEWMIRNLILRFHEVWIPDWEGDATLTGGMAVWRHKRPPLFYIGPQSRFSPMSTRLNRDKDLIVILSGPEPQRTHFEEKIRQQLSQIPGNHILIRGVIDDVPPHFITSPHVAEFDILPAEVLQHWIGRSRMQVSRSGYSTVMDLVFSGIPALMVPTPGQFEQEYLCLHLQGKGPWIFQQQDELDIGLAWKALAQLSNATIQPPPPDANHVFLVDFYSRWQLHPGS
jgi:UDP:flavonoid glycosyltransferase YjiC (YdhE family)